MIWDFSRYTNPGHDWLVWGAIELACVPIWFWVGLIVWTVVMLLLGVGIAFRIDDALIKGSQGLQGLQGSQGIVDRWTAETMEVESPHLIDSNRKGRR